MRYILNSEGYIYDIAFGTEIECDLGTSTLYAGEVPTGYSTLEEWHDGEIDKLNAWKIVDGNLVFDNARYNELQSEWEKEATENKQIVKKDLKNIEQMLTSVSDTNKSQYVSDSTDGKIITVSNASNIFPSVKVTDIDPYSYNKLDFIITGENMLRNDATSKELNGMSFTQNADRSITINGTATSDIEYNIGGTSLNTSPFLCFKKGIEYYLSGLKGQIIKMYYFDGTNRTQIYRGSSGTITFTDSDKLVTQIVLSIPSGKVIKKVTLYPMLSIDERDKEVMKITLYGKSTQATSTNPVSPSPDNPSEIECVKGKNLFDKNSVETQIGYFTSDGTLKSGGNSTVTTTYTKILPNTDMTISGFALEWICFYDKNKNFIERVSGTLKTFNKNAYYIRIQAPTNVFDLSKIQLEAGTVATNYLPYNTIQVKNVGKNLFDKDNVKRIYAYIQNNTTWRYYNDSYSIRIPVKPNANYVISADNPNETIFRAGVTDSSDIPVSGTNVALYSTTRYSNTNTPIYITTGANAKYIVIQVAEDSANDTFNTLQVEVGTQATTYEPYQENITNIDLQGNELCSLPNNVKDELVIENGRAKIIKNVGKYNITGNEAWALSGTESQPYINFGNYVDNCKYPATSTTLPNLLSNYYLQITRNNLYNGRITLSPSKALIIYDTVHNTSLANFKEWLKSAGVVVYYQLATPIEIDLGFSDDLFFVVEENINITNDDNADMKIDTTTPNYKEYKGSTFFIDFTDYIKDGLFPSDELFPSDSLYPQGTTISYIDVSNSEIKAFINDNMEYLGEGNIPIFEGCNTLYTLQDTFLHYKYSTNVLIYNPSRYGANEENPTLKSSYYYKDEWEVDGTTYTEEYTDDARFFSNGLKFVEDWSNDYPESTGYGKWKNIIELYNDYKFPFFELRKELDTGYWNSTTISPSGIDITDSENISYNSSTHIYRSGITTPTVTQTSLKESKKNFEKLNNALEIIKATDIYKYNLKYENDDDKKHIGFVIGDDFKYSKEITSLNNDGVDIYSMISVCFKAIQEQQMIIEKLENKIKELEVK